MAFKSSGGLEELNAVKELLLRSILASPNPTQSEKKILKEAG